MCEKLNIQNFKKYRQLQGLFPFHQLQLYENFSTGLEVSCLQKQKDILEGRMWLKLMTLSSIPRKSDNQLQSDFRRLIAHSGQNQNLKRTPTLKNMSIGMQTYKAQDESGIQTDVLLIHPQKYLLWCSLEASH